jgi:tRNA(fMet)-specific endonuclease VapC
MNYLLDTNIISAFLKQPENVKKKLREVRQAGGQVFFSSISYFETQRGLLATQTQATRKMEVFEAFCQCYEMLGTDQVELLDEASIIYADLKNRGELLLDADILIAATARSHNLTLVTDDSHFERIEGLTVENWLKS